MPAKVSTRTVDPTRADVIIVGGGIIGAATARSLALAGASVTLLERPDRIGAAWEASAGMLAAQVEARSDDPILPLALAGRAWFDSNVPALQRTTGIDVGWRTTGILQLAHHQGEMAELTARVGWQRHAGLRADWLDEAELSARWPWLGPALGAFWSPDDGAIDPQPVVAALRADAVRLGAHIVTDTVVSLEHRDGKLLGVTGARERYAGGTVVITAGAWSAQIDSLPRQLPVEPVRGQMLAYPWPAGAATGIVYGDGCYLLRRGDELLLGATVEHVGFDATVTAEGIGNLQRRGRSVFPALETMEPKRSWAGLRPGTPDGLPIIGPEPRLAGLWYATGHGRNGILLSGITGDLVTRGIVSAVVDDGLAAFAPTRFRDW